MTYFYLFVIIRMVNGMKKVVLCLFILLLCGCSFNRNNEVQEPVYDYEFLGNAKELKTKYNMDYENIDMEFSYVYGHNDTFELYMENEITDENRLDGYLKLIDFLKNITDDNKILNLSNEEISEKNIDKLSKGLFLKGIINETNYKINIYQYSNKELDNYKYSTYEINFVKIAN